MSDKFNDQARLDAKRQAIKAGMTDQAADEYARRITDKEHCIHCGAPIDTKGKYVAPRNDSLNEALNSGDGTYRP